MNDLEQMAIERLKAASDMSLMAYQQPLVICNQTGTVKPERRPSPGLQKLWRNNGVETLGRKRDDKENS